MLEHFANFLNALGNADSGTECVLSADAYNSLIGLVRSFYGAKYTDYVKHAFTRQVNISACNAVRYVMVTSEVGDELLDLLNRDAELENDGK